MVTRIIGGSGRGRRLQSFAGYKLRPTSARVREAIFDLIGPVILNAKVLDLFAGIGSLGVEALSRGASFVAFVEENPDAVKLIAKNIKLIPGAEAKIYKGKVEKILSSTLFGCREFEIIMMDPPYVKNLVPLTLTAVAAADVARPGAIIVSEHSSSQDLDVEIIGLTHLKSKKYGDTSVSVFEIS